MTVKPLSDISFDELLNCFLSAFENYFVQMPTQKQYYQERWKASKVDFNLSYGMFDQGKLVGFIIHSIDKRFGVLTAYNSGTGVIPDYRGKRIVKSIYEYALRDLKKHGITKSTLEVITTNVKAIRSYKDVGFKITKTYKCFNGRIETENFGTYKLEEINVNDLDWDNLPNQNFYSWENQKDSILAGSFTYFQVVYNGKGESFFIIKPESGYIAQLDILSSDNHSWNRLFHAIQSISPTIKINNVDERLAYKIKALKNAGLENLIDQYEMELILEK